MTDTVLVKRWNQGGKEPFFHFKPATGDLVEARGVTTHTHGWLVDKEVFLSGERPIVFWWADDKCFVALGSKHFEIGEGKASLAHYKSLFTSEFTVVDAQGKPHDVKYVTPWWRLVFDDGMFPDLNFPLERLPHFFLSKAKVDGIAKALDKLGQTT